MEKFNKDFLKNIPRVYNEKDSIINKNYELNLTYNRKVIVEKTFDLALELHPNIKKIYTIEGNLQDSMELKKILPKKIKQFPKIEFIRIIDFTFKELKEKVRNLDKNSIILYSIITEDKNKEQITPKYLVQNLIKINPQIPSYSFLSTFINTGVMGGHMLDAKLNAKSAIDALMDFNKNKTFKDKREYKSAQSLIDWHHIKKYNIKESNIPKNVTIINKEKSIFESFYFEVLSAFILIMALIILLLASLYLLYKLKTTNNKLKKETKEKLKKERLLNLQKKSAFMGEMISSIAHQWRQPLSRINSNISVIILLLNKYKIDEQKIIYKLKNIEDQTNYMSKTIDDFSDFLSPNKKKISFNIKESILKALNLLNIKLNKIEIIFDLSPAVEIFSYENEFSQVILTIVNNSLEIFANRNIKEPKLYISLKEFENKIQISIKDNGKGISEEFKDKIFQAYASSKQNNKFNGLGLYISKNIIEKSMQGKLEVENDKEGAIFIITLERNN